MLWELIVQIYYRSSSAEQASPTEPEAQKTTGENTGEEKEIKVGESEAKTDKKSARNERILRPESPFHKNCHLSEPSRDFVAKPVPPNLLANRPPPRQNGNFDSLTSFIFLKNGHPRPLFCLFSSFQATMKFFTQINVKK